MQATLTETTTPPAPATAEATAPEQPAAWTWHWGREGRETAPPPYTVRVRGARSYVELRVEGNAGVPDLPSADREFRAGVRASVLREVADSPDINRWLAMQKEEAAMRQRHDQLKAKVEQLAGQRAALLDRADPAGSGQELTALARQEGEAAAELATVAGALEALRGQVDACREKAERAVRGFADAAVNRQRALWKAREAAALRELLDKAGGVLDALVRAHRDRQAIGSASTDPGGLTRGLLDELARA